MIQLGDALRASMNRRLITPSSRLRLACEMPRVRRQLARQPSSASLRRGQSIERLLDFEADLLRDLPTADQLCSAARAWRARAASPPPSKMRQVKSSDAVPKS